MEIKLDFKVLIFLIIFFITKQVEIYLIVMSFGIIHEIGHLLAGICLGLKPKQIGVIPIGLSISFKTTNIDYNKKIKRGSLLNVKKLIIAIAGPLVNVLIAILFIFVSFGLNKYVREQIIYTNIIIAFFNLIPIYPMDGGRILKECIHIIKGYKYSYKWINKISNISIIILTIFSSIVILYMKNISVIFILIYLWYLVLIENKKYARINRIERIIAKQKNIL